MLKSLGAGICILLLNFLYLFFRLFPTQPKKVILISRQNNYPSVDFKLLQTELKKRHLKTVVLCRRLEPNFRSAVAYVFYLPRLLYHIATAKVTVLDSYCIPISGIWHHKKTLVVIQIWHALGALKKFGFSTLGLADGRDPKIAKIMRMHRNYHYILTSGRRCREAFQEAFGARPEQMLVMSLPRVDFLLNSRQPARIRRRFNKVYRLNKTPEQLSIPPESTKSVASTPAKAWILYCPTQHNYQDSNLAGFRQAIDWRKYNLIIKTHGGSELVFINDHRVKPRASAQPFFGMELLFAADYVVTDYSAIIYEAAILNKPLFFLKPHFKKYQKARGFYENYSKIVPGPLADTPAEIISLIESRRFNHPRTHRFAEKYIDDLSGQATAKLANFIKTQAD